MGEAVEVALIGFGEASNAFAAGMAGTRLRAFDVRPVDYDGAGVTGCASAAEAVAQAGLILSLVTADQSLAAAASVADGLRPGALFCDMNSVAPDTKREAAGLIERAGGRYVDVAILSPVAPARTAAPLLLSGPHVGPAADALCAAGFSDVAIVEGAVGAASAIKMIRSVMVKGIEALSAECFLAAAAAGVSADVIASLDASWPGADWAQRGDYNLDRMLVHGLRRAAEMDEVVKTLESLGFTGQMARATAAWQRAIGGLGSAPPEGLAAKTSLILDRKAQAA